MICFQASAALGDEDCVELAVALAPPLRPTGSRTYGPLKPEEL
jgi:hypothetical protein